MIVKIERRIRPADAEDLPFISECTRRAYLRYVSDWVGRRGP